MAFIHMKRIGAVYRCYSSWLKQIFSRTTPKLSDPSQENRSERIQEIGPSEHLEQLVRHYLPQHHGSWTSAPLHHDVDLKSKVLLSCEKQFDCTFSDQQLGSIRTFQDVLKLVSRPKRPAPQTVFPKIECMESLPANLSVHAASIQASIKKQTRKPFQNYDSPEHSKFLNKQQKEAKKRKRRHLTAIVKYYN